MFALLAVQVSTWWLHRSIPYSTCSICSSRSIDFRGGGGGLWLYFVYWGCTALKGMFFTISVWEGCCFQPNSLARVRFSCFLSGKGVAFRRNSLARGVSWSWFDTKILARAVILPFFWDGWEILSGKDKGMPLWTAQPYPYLVKRHPPPGG